MKKNKGIYVYLKIIHKKIRKYKLNKIEKFNIVGPFVLKL